eukprot:15447846-Alexandrium_andersonii.AAC.1
MHARTRLRVCVMSASAWTDENSQEVLTQDQPSENSTGLAFIQPALPPSDIHVAHARTSQANPDPHAAGTWPREWRACGPSVARAWPALGQHKTQQVVHAQPES